MLKCRSEQEGLVYLAMSTERIDASGFGPRSELCCVGPGGAKCYTVVS